MKKYSKEILQYSLIIIAFIVVSYIYFTPVIQGKVLPQMDFEHSKSIAQEANTYQKTLDRDIAWTNSLFGGMPTYQVGGFSKKNIFAPLLRLLNKWILPYATVSVLFIYMIGFFILLLVFKVDKWLAGVGSLAFALSSYNIIIIAAGHITKTYAIGFMPIVFAGVILLYDKKYWLGSIITLLGLGLQIATSHIQIIYYTGLAVGLFILFEFFKHLGVAFLPTLFKVIVIKYKEADKNLKHFFIASGLLVGVVFLTILPNIPTIWQAYEISKYSIRGKSELTSAKEVGSGLDKDYAMAWSYGIGETWTLLVPNAKGGGTEYIGNNPDNLVNVDSQFKETIAQQNQYWGNQPFTSGPVYFGAIILFLFVLGLLVLKNPIKWWILTATIFSIILSWGSNFEIITNIFFNNFPFFNKFRTVSMILVVASVTVPLLAMLTLKEILEDKEFFKKNIKKYILAFGLTGGLALIFWLIPSLFSFLSAEEANYFNSLIQDSPSQAGQINAFIKQLENARITIFKTDAIRSFLFIFAFGALFWLVMNMKNKQAVKVITVVLFILFISDLWAVDLRYLNSDDFVSKSKAREAFEPKPVDKIILKDTDQNYRVLNITTSTFNDAFTSYFHKSIGGYHGAKIRRYQDIIDKQIQPSIQSFVKSFQDTSFNMNYVLGQLQVINMLNTKYIIYDPNQFPIVNTQSYGNAWFVDSYKFVKTADEEINALNEVNLRQTAIINETKFDKSNLPELNKANDTLRQIRLVKYEPDNLEFEVISQNGGFVVFSEIYYPKGWTATVSGEKTDIYQTNYILRGVKVPAGKHTIILEFKPDAIFVANKIATIGSILVLLVVVFAIVRMFLKFKDELKSENTKTEIKNNKINK